MTDARQIDIPFPAPGPKHIVGSGHVVVSVEQLLSMMPDEVIERMHAKLVASGDIKPHEGSKTS